MNLLYSAGTMSGNDAQRPRLPAADVRAGTLTDVPGVLELWVRSASAPSVTDDAESLNALIRHDPDALLLVEIDGNVVASLIATWNGWRGSFFRLVVDAAYRRRGLARMLVREGERSLCARGAQRLDAIVESDDDVAASVWQALGYERQATRVRFVRNFTARRASRLLSG